MVDSVRNKLKILKIVLWSILGAILLFILIVVSTLLVDKYVKKSTVPMFAGYGTMIVISPSMSGTIEKGDLIIVKRMDEYKPGDIVTYTLPNGMANTHRLVNYADESKTSFITKGDASPDIDQVLDPPVMLDDICGKVVGTIPKVGIFFEWVTSESGWIYIVALLVVVVAGAYFLNMTKSNPEEVAEISEATPEDTTGDPTSPLKDTTENPVVTSEDTTDTHAE